MQVSGVYSNNPLGLDDPERKGMCTTGNLELSDLTPILFGHAAFQYLNAGCELGLFQLLQQHSDLTKEENPAEDRAGREGRRYLAVG